jgi:hypothetical protein
MKLGLRFLLLLSFFVLGKQTISYAGTEEDNTIAIITPAHPEHHESIKLKAVELSVEDQDEVSSIKKQSVAGHFLSSFTYALSPVAIDKRYTCSLALSKPYTYSTPDKHILYQVFRI